MNIVREWMARPFRRRLARLSLAEIKAIYIGQWVAILNSRVIASAPTASACLAAAIALGRPARGCVIVHIARPEEIQRWAARWGNQIYPNDQFHSREEAEAWARSCRHRGPAVLMELVEDDDSLHGHWREVGLVKT